MLHAALLLLGARTLLVAPGLTTRNKKQVCWSQPCSCWRPPWMRILHVCDHDDHASLCRTITMHHSLCVPGVAIVWSHGRWRCWALWIGQREDLWSVPYPHLTNKMLAKPIRFRLIRGRPWLPCFSWLYSFVKLIKLNRFDKVCGWKNAGFLDSCWAGPSRCPWLTICSHKRAHASHAWLPDRAKVVRKELQGSEPNSFCILS